MGGLAGASGGRFLTRWVHGLGEVQAGTAAAVILSPGAPEHAAHDGPAIDDVSRHATRHRAFGALARRVLASPVAVPRLIAGADGIRRIDGTHWFGSVAERDGWVAAALAPHAVGVDIEGIADAEAARDAVLAGVAADIAAWHGPAGIWSAREAVLKAVGRDLTRDPGGWCFGDGIVTATGIPRHHVDVVALAGMVAAVAYVGD